jgi:hypothetical protein
MYLSGHQVFRSSMSEATELVLATHDRIHNQSRTVSVQIISSWLELHRSEIGRSSFALSPER